MTASTDSGSTPTTAIAPVPPRAAFAILGSMIFLILALMAVLAQTTWVAPAAAAAEPSIVLSS